MKLEQKEFLSCNSFLSVDWTFPYLCRLFKDDRDLRCKHRQPHTHAQMHPYISIEIFPKKLHLCKIYSQPIFQIISLLENRKIIFCNFVLKCLILLFYFWEANFSFVSFALLKLNTKRVLASNSTFLHLKQKPWEWELMYNCKKVAWQKSF